MPEFALPALHALPCVAKLGVDICLATVVQLAVTGWMLAVAVVDHRTARIPNALVAPVMLGVGGLRLMEGLFGNWPRLLLVVPWVAVFGLWMLHFIGGGDAKFVMGQYALFPSMEYTAALALILLIITVPLLAWEARGRSIGDIRRSLTGRLVTGQVLPTEVELHERGRQYAWTLALPGIVYTWLYW